jgi:hypothetical protein
MEELLSAQTHMGLTSATRQADGVIFRQSKSFALGRIITRAVKANVGRIMMEKTTGA